MFIINNSIAKNHCEMIQQQKMPSALRSVCGTEHPHEFSQAILVSKNKIEIECLFSSFVPKYTYHLATKINDSWENKPIGFAEIKKRDCFKTKLPKLEKAVFAGGCFWCMESDFEKLSGVTNVVSGFTGGELVNPTYKGNHRGHYEAVEITYNPQQIKYTELLTYYWHHIDPFDARGQFCDKGKSYLSAIFINNEDEKKWAEASKKLLVQQFSKQQIITPILKFSKFYPIKGSENYHQDYYKKNPVRYKLYRWNCGRDQRLKEIWGEIGG